MKAASRYSMKKASPARSWWGRSFVCLIMLPGAIYLGLVAGAAPRRCRAVGDHCSLLRDRPPLVSAASSGRKSTACFTWRAHSPDRVLAVCRASPAARSAASSPPSTSCSRRPWRTLSIFCRRGSDRSLAPPAYAHRTFLDAAWAVPIAVMLFGQIFDRMKWMGLGYLLFRITSDVERLPFPFAAIAASGATALAEASTKEDSWRWQVFSTGTIIGLIFGFFYLAVPIFTGVALGKPVQLLPIPFVDLTPSTERILPTALTGYNPDLGLVLFGFLLPFSIVLGGFISSITAQIVANPIMYHIGAAHLVNGQNGIFPTGFTVRRRSKPRPRLTLTSGCRSASGLSLPLPGLASPLF